MALIFAPPSTPHTPVDLFAALALSPSAASACFRSIPSLTISPPSPNPAPVILIPEIKHRNLAPNEAKQLTLLLTQYFLPVRSSSKGMMAESIKLAEKLHEAGIRWDRKRRVMGMHLRGIWDEGQKLGRGVGGHSTMEYVYILASATGGRCDVREYWS